jgi:L-alanine-DL-glutamate epimerase-like enolase superfamily enzyme
MLRELNIEHRSLRLSAPFRISRGVKYSADVIHVELRQDGSTGRGESVPYARYGESIASVIEQLEAMRGGIIAGMGREELQARLPAGAARNALDAALWDLESRLASIPVWAQLARPPRASLISALTISIDTPENMGEAARQIAHVGLLKIKVDAHDPAARIDAVRRAAPGARLIVDPNESWDIELLQAMQPVLERNRVDLVEQPLPARDDDALTGFSSRIPICADESCHVTSDLERLRNRYQAVNIKLDKTGGLTEAWRLLRSARGQGFMVMIGCMICPSLGIAPALELAREAEFVDLDGPLWLQQDHADGVTLRDGLLMPPRSGFWGG